MCPVILAICSYPEWVTCRACRVESLLASFVSVILTWCLSFVSLCSFLLKTCFFIYERGSLKVTPVWRCYC